VRPICLGSSLAPFRILRLENAIIPWDGQKLLAGEELDRFPGLRSWWDKAQGLWEANRPDYSTDDLIGRIEYKDGTSKQFPIAPIRVVYAASGSNLVAARLMDDRAMASETTYWAACGSEEESHYLTAILNSQSLLDRIRDLQAQGQFGTRHFHKVVFAAGFPLFDPTDEVHQEIASLGMQAEAVAGGLDVEGVRFQKARRVAADALTAAGLRDELDVRVKEVLA
jgi:hypothetical protein